MTDALTRADPDAPLLAEFRAAVAELDRLTRLAGCPDQPGAPETG